MANGRKASPQDQRLCYIFLKHKLILNEMKIQSRQQISSKVFN